jgi:hypothetical protein
MKQNSNSTEFFPYRVESTEKQYNVIKILSYTGQKKILQKHFIERNHPDLWLNGTLKVRGIRIEEKFIHPNIQLNRCRMLPETEFEEKIKRYLDHGSVIRLLKYTGITHNLNEHLKLTKEGVYVFETDKDGSNFVVKIKTIWDERWIPKESRHYNGRILRYLNGLQKD